jgi:hypothetical protein
MENDMKKLIMILITISMCSVLMGCSESSPQDHIDNDLLLDYTDEYITTSISYLNELTSYALDDNSKARGYCDFLIQQSNDLDYQISGLKTTGEYTSLKNELNNLTDDMVIGCSELKSGLISLDEGDYENGNLGIQSFNNYSILIEEHINNCYEIIDRINE